MSKILIVAEHDGGKLNASTLKCVTCATRLPDATIISTHFRFGWPEPG